MKTVNGAPQFEGFDFTDPDSELGFVNEALREWTGYRACVNCIFNDDPEVGCPILNMARTGDEYFKFSCEPETFSCAAFEDSPDSTATEEKK